MVEVMGRLRHRLGQYYLLGHRLAVVTVVAVAVVAVVAVAAAVCASHQYHQDWADPCITLVSWPGTCDDSGELSFQTHCQIF